MTVQEEKPIGETGWEQQAAADIKRLATSEPRMVFQRTPAIERAFTLSGRLLCCGDEGVPHGVHLPGSGVLLPLEELKAVVAAAGIEELTSHDNCGAYRMKFPGDQNPNRGAEEWGRRTASLLGIKHRHITAAGMDRPVSLHAATCVYYDGTGSFNRIPGLPSGFVVSRRFSPTGLQDLQRYLSIAFGEHGLGDRLTPRQPFHVIVLPHPTDLGLSHKVLSREAVQAVVPYGRRVRVGVVKTGWHMRNLAQ